MKRMLIFCTLLFIFSLAAEAQFSRYIVKFTDKGSNPFSLSNPLQFLSQRSLDRRLRYGIAIDSTDLPVTPRYIDSLRLSGNVTILTISKWLNQVAIQTTDIAAINKINSFPFVLSNNPIAARSNNYIPVNKKLDIPATNNSFTNNPTQSANNYYDYGQSTAQVKIHNGEFLHNHGFRGEGMQMAILDAGFFHYQTLPTFDSVRNNNQILGTWDFVDNELSVNEDYYHGMQCFSTIAANMPGTFIGTAPNTLFYLYRTEDVASEFPIEEQNWAAGIEKADSAGIDISSTSLGYSKFDNTLFDYSYSTMDGNTTISAIAADLAAKKGILVVAAAGNEGNSTWHYLITPSDADSSLSVGAVSIFGNAAGFSSYGPSADGQIKPSVAAVGLNTVVANTSDGQPTFNSGTSFACPNMAGIATCLWQAFPEINNMGIINALESSATRSENPDDRIGYGIPDAKKAFVILIKKIFSQQSTVTDCNMQLQFSVKTDPSMNIELERKGPNESAFTLISANFPVNDPFSMHSFSYADALGDLSLGAYQYRLKMTISTDTSFYLDTIDINYTQSCELPAINSIAIGPNPFSDQFNIILGRTAETKLEIVVQNAAGQRVYVNNLQQPAGLRTIAVPMQNMSKGIYFVTVYADNKREITKKIVKN